MGLTNFRLISNEKLAHNHAVIDADGDAYPKALVVDSWTGQGAEELTFKTKLKLRHFDANIKGNANLHEWLEEYGAAYVQVEEARRAVAAVGTQAGPSGTTE